MKQCFGEREKKASKVRFDKDIPLSCFWLESGSQRCNFLVRGNRSDITEAPESHKYERACLESRSSSWGCQGCKAKSATARTSEAGAALLGCALS